MLSGKDKSLLCNSLVGILRACENRTTEIDLRNESKIIGRIENVTPEMNVTMTNAILTNLRGEQKKFNEITIRGSNIRFFHVPDSIDMIRALQNSFKSIKKLHGFRDKRKPKPKKEQPTKLFICFIKKVVF